MIVIETEALFVIFLNRMFLIALNQAKICMGEKNGEIRFGSLFKWSACLSSGYVDVNMKTLVQILIVAIAVYHTFIFIPNGFDWHIILRPLLSQVIKCHKYIFKVCVISDHSLLE
jgi:hypothetical protein